MTKEKILKAKNLHKSLKSSMQALQILRGDVQFAEKQLNQHKDFFEQTCRRNLIRCVCAIVDGTLSFMKNASLPAADFFDIKLSDKEIEVATGRNTDGKPLRFLPFPENVKETFKVFMKSHGVQIEVSYNDQGFVDLCNTFKLRNNLMHPKTHLDIEVSDKAFETAIRGVKWFDTIGVNIMKRCEQKTISASTS